MAQSLQSLNPQIAPPEASPSAITPEALFELMRRDSAQWQEAHQPPFERSALTELPIAFARGVLIEGPAIAGKAVQAVSPEGSLPERAGKALADIEKTKFLRPSAPETLSYPMQIAQQAFQMTGLSLGLTLPAVAVGVLTGNPLTTSAVIGFTVFTPLVMGAAEVTAFKDDVRTGAERAGLPPEKIREIVQAVGGKAFLSGVTETGFEGLSNLIDVLLLKTGVGRAAANVIKEHVKAGANLKRAITPSLTRRAAQLYGGMVLSEAGTEAPTAAIQTALRQAAGVQTGYTPGEAAGEAALVATVAGGLMATAGTVIQSKVRAQTFQTLADPTRPLPERQAALNQVAEAMADLPDIQRTFRQYGQQAIDFDQPIPLTKPLRDLMAGLRPETPATDEAPGEAYTPPPSPPEDQEAVQAPPQFAPRTTQLLEPGAEELAPTGRPPLVPSTTTSEEAERQRAAEMATQGSTLVQSPDGTLGEIRYTPTGQVEFIQPARRPLADEVPLVADAQEFQALFAPAGIAPEQVETFRQRFFAREAPTLAGEVLPVAEDVAAPVPTPETLPSETPISQRLVEAQDTALRFVITQQAQGFAAFDFAKAVEALAITHTIPQPEAQRILSEALAAAQAPTARPPGPRLPAALGPRRPSAPMTPPAGAITQAVQPTTAPATTPASPVPTAQPLTTQAGAISAAVSPPAAESQAAAAGPTPSAEAAPPLPTDPTPAAARGPGGEPTLGLGPGTETPSPEAPAGLPGAAQPELGPSQQFATAPRPTLAEFTLADVQAAFPGQKVTQRPDGTYRVSLPRNRHVTISQVESIAMGEEELLAFELGYAEPFRGERLIAGRIQGTRIELVRGTADRVTLRHEVEHFLENSGLLTREEVRSLNQAAARALGVDSVTTEQRAQWVAEQLNAREYRQDTSLGRALDKVWDFFDKLLGLVGIQTTRGVLRAIETGQVFGREATPAAAETQQFQAQAAQPPGTPRPPSGAPLPTEAKLYTAYLGALNLMTPEIAELLHQSQAAFTKTIVNRERMTREVRLLRDRWDANPARFLALRRMVTEGRKVMNVFEQNAVRSVIDDWGDMLTTGWASGLLTEDQFTDHLRHTMLPLYDMAEGTGSEYGRGLRAQQDRPPWSRLGERLLKFQAAVKLPPEEFAAWLQRMAEVLGRNDPAEIDSFADSLTLPGLWDYFRELRYGSIMSGPSTNIANLMGNVFMGYFNQGPLRLLEGVYSTFAMKNQPHDMQRRYVSEVWPALVGYTRGFRPERLRILPTFMRGGHAAVTAMPGLKGLPFISKFEQDIGQHREAWARATWRLDFDYATRLGISQETYRAMFAKVGALIGADVRPGQPIKSMRYVAPYVTLAMRAMTAVDILSGFAAYDSEVAAMAERQARNEEANGKLGGKSVAQRRAELMVQVPQATHEAALSHAEKLTLMDRPSVLGRYIMQGRNLPGLRIPMHLLFPFVRAPDRLITRALELVPGLGYLIMRATGTPTPELFAKQVAGTLLMTMVLEMYLQGLITGAPPENPNEREAFYRQGKQAYSVTFPGTTTSISYARWEPLHLVFGFVPNFGEAWRKAHERDNELDALALATAGGMAMAHQIFSSSYLSGLEPLIQAVTGRGRRESFLGRQVDSFIPYAGMRRTLQRVVDAANTGEGSLVRDPKGFFETIAGVDLIAPVRLRHNVWGEPVTIPGNILSQFWPHRIAAETLDPTERELRRHGYYPGPPSQTMAGHKLSQEVYDRYAQDSGRLAKEKLDRVVSSPMWDQMSDALQKRALARAISEARAQVRSQLERAGDLPRRGLPAAVGG